MPEEQPVMRIAWDRFVSLMSRPSHR